MRARRKPRPAVDAYERELQVRDVSDNMRADKLKRRRGTRNLVRRSDGGRRWPA